MRKHIIQDDRTAEQQLTHRHLVIARDKCMSGWGLAEGGASVAVWACENEAHALQILAWVESRPDMRNVRLRYPEDKPFKPNSNVVHTHIYVVRSTHPRLCSA